MPDINNELLDEKLEVSQEELQAKAQEAFSGIAQNNLNPLNELIKISPEAAKSIVSITTTAFPRDVVESLIPRINSPELRTYAINILDEKDFFMSQGMVSSLTSVSNAMMSFFDSTRRLGVSVGYDFKDQTTAYTDGNSIFINCANSIIQMGKTLREKTTLTEGMLAHEIAHTLYTDFEARKRFIMSFEMKQLPDFTCNIEDYKADNFDAALAMLKEDVEKELIPPSVLASFMGNLDNILEDGYIETRFLKDFKGELANALITLQNIFYKDAQNIEELDKAVEAQPEALSGCAMSVLLTYAKYNGVVKSNTKDYDIQGSPCYQFVENALPFARAATTCDYAVHRNELKFAAFVSLYPVLKEDILKSIIKGTVKFDPQNAQTPGQGGQSGGGSSGGEVTINPQLGGGGGGGSQNSSGNPVHLDQSVDEISEELKKALEHALQNVQDLNKGVSNGQGGGQPNLDAESQRKYEEALKKAWEDKYDDLQDAFNKQSTDDSSNSDGRAGDKGQGKEQNSNVGGNNSGSSSSAGNSSQKGNSGQNSGNMSSGSSSDRGNMSAEEIRKQGQAGGAGSSGGEDDKKIEVSAPSVDDIIRENNALAEEEKLLQEHEKAVQETNESMKDMVNQLDENLKSQLDKINDSINSLSQEAKTVTSPELRAKLEKRISELREMSWSINKAIREGEYWGSYEAEKITVPFTEKERLKQAYDARFGKYEELGRDMSAIFKELVENINANIRQVNQLKGNLHIGSLINNIARDLGNSELHFYSNTNGERIDEFARVAVITDNSGSMHGRKIETAKRLCALIAGFCEELNMPYSMTFFSDNSSNLDITDFEKSRGEAEKTALASNTLDAYMGGTDIAGPLVNLNTKLSKLPTALGNILVIISDGETNNAMLAMESIMSMKEERNVIPVVLIFDESPRSGKSSVYMAWEGIFADYASVLAANTGVSLEEALQEMAELASETLIDCSDLNSVPQILGEKFADIIMNDLGNQVQSF